MTFFERSVDRIWIIINGVPTHFYYYRGSEFRKMKPENTSQSNTIFLCLTQSGESLKICAPCNLVYTSILSSSVHCFIRFSNQLMFVFCRFFDHFSGFYLLHVTLINTPVRSDPGAHFFSL